MAAFARWQSANRSLTSSAVQYFRDTPSTKLIRDLEGRAARDAEKVRELAVTVPSKPLRPRCG